MVDPVFDTLQAMGLEVEVRHGHLLLNSIPYVDAQRTVRRGILVTDLTGNIGALGRPNDHLVWFVGDLPHKQDGRSITNLKVEDASTRWPGFTVNFRFSNKPEAYVTTGFPDYVTKMLHYISVICPEASAIDPAATPFTGKVLIPEEDESVFLYWDTAASRAGILAMAAKLAMPRVAVVGLGGTGSYVLDQLAKTPIREIHLYDGDVFDQHNAFRAPGAATVEQLRVRPLKVDYFGDMFKAMHSGIRRHAYRITGDNVGELADFDFVFLCVDKPAVRKLIGEYLIRARVPYVDAGMDLIALGDPDILLGTCRVTLCTPDKSDHFARRAPLDGGEGDDVYRSNIQVADMNALNAIMAVMKWKQYCEFYQDVRRAHHLTFSINDHALTCDETASVEQLVE